MKGLLLIIGVLALTIFPVQAGAHISVSIGGGGGGGFHGTFATSGYRCGYAASCYTPYRACNYATYPYANRYCYPYYNYGYNYGYNYVGYSPYSYYPNDYNVVSYSPEPPSYIPPQQVPTPEPAPAPQAVATAPAPAAPAPAPAQLDFGILDVNGFVHSPYSDAIFKVPGVRNAQMVYDPVTGKPFLVR